MRKAFVPIAIAFLLLAGFAVGQGATRKKASSKKGAAAKKTGTAASKKGGASKGAAAAKKGSTATGTAKTGARKSGTRVSARRKGSRRGSRASAQPAQTWRSRQLAPSPDRYTEIQQALIRKGYLKGDASGQWDESSVDALRRFQQEQNLKPTGKIDSLSLIALGLGPKYDSAAVTPAAATAPPRAPDTEKK